MKLLPEGVLAEVSMPRIGWGNQRLVVDGKEVQSIHGWPEFRAQAHRENVDSFSRKLQCVLDRAGRHSISTNSF